MAEQYDVTIATVRPNAHPQALAVLGKTLAGDKDLLACWYSDLGALNQIMLIRKVTDAAATIAARQAALSDPNPLGIGEFITSLAMDTTCRSTSCRRCGRALSARATRCALICSSPAPSTPTAELWRKAVPGRMTVSPVLAAMTSVTGAVARFLHIWPYTSLNERARLREKAVADGVWPPPGGPSLLAAQQADIYLPAAFSPMR